MRKFIRMRQEEQRLLELKKNSKDRIPPNSKYFDVRSSLSRSSVRATNSKLKWGNSINQRSLQSLNIHPQKLINKEEHDK